MSASFAESAVRQLLKNSAALVALVGDRIEPHMNVQSEQLPRVAYSRISGDHVHSHMGASGLCNISIQISSFAENYLKAKQLGELVRLAIDGFRGNVGSVHVGSVQIENDVDGFEASPGLDAKRIYSIQQDYSVWFEEAKPVFAS